MPYPNAFLAALSPADAAALGPHLKSLELKSKQALFEAGGTVRTVYFPGTAAISLVVGLSTGEMVESAMIGRDGVVGGWAALDGMASFSDAVVQLGGEAFACDVEVLRRAALQSQDLLSLLVRHEQAIYAQAQQSTACMAVHEIQSRLCRWLLRARDLSRSDSLNFTQEYLAELLGVRRTSVTSVALTLQQAGLIRYSRGQIQVLNVEGLQDTSCECYERVKSQYANLMRAR